MSFEYQIVPLTDAPAQRLQVTLGEQVCLINVFTKHLYTGDVPSGGIPTDPPVYIPVNPVFMDLYVNDALLLGGVLCLNGVRIVRDAYLGFIGDLAFYDLEGEDDPAGMPARAAPVDTRSWWAATAPKFLGGQDPPQGFAGAIPGLGTRFVLTYWPSLA